MSGSNSPGVQAVQLFVVEGGALKPLAGVANLYSPIGVAGDVNFFPSAIYGADPADTPNAKAVTAQGIGADAIDPALNPGYVALSVGSFSLGYNGAKYDRLRTASAVNSNPALTKIGVLQAVGAGNWCQTDSAAVSTNASTVKAAVAGARHVCTSMTFTLSCVVAQAAPLTCQLLDNVGAIWRARFMGTIGESVTISLSGLNIVGGVGNSMTLQTAGVPAAGNFLTVALAGYTVG